MKIVQVNKYIAADPRCKAIQRLRIQARWFRRRRVDGQEENPETQAGPEYRE
jgi:hypothetical protein